VRPSSAKAKGRRLQQWVRDQILLIFKDLQEDDVRSNPMGAPGEDLLLSPLARKLFPYSVECKNVEKLNIWGSIDQCTENGGANTPMIIFKKNGREPYVAIPFDKMSDMLRRLNEETYTICDSDNCHSCRNLVPKPS